MSGCCCQPWAACCCRPDLLVEVGPRGWHWCMGMVTLPVKQAFPCVHHGQKCCWPFVGWVPTPACKFVGAGWLKMLPSGTSCYLAKLPRLAPGGDRHPQLQLEVPVYGAALPAQPACPAAPQPPSLAFPFGPARLACLSVPRRSVQLLASVARPQEASPGLGAHWSFTPHMLQLLVCQVSLCLCP